MYECTEFRSSQFILAHLQWHEVKHKRRLYTRPGKGKRGWRGRRGEEKGGNRRSGFAPVVSEGFSEVGKRAARVDGG